MLSSFSLLVLSGFRFVMIVVFLIGLSSNNFKVLRVLAPN